MTNLYSMATDMHMANWEPFPNNFTMRKCSCHLQEMMKLNHMYNSMM